MKHVIRLFLFVPALALVSSVSAAGQLPFEDVVRNLRNPDPQIRMDALQVLRDARYPEAVVPIAALVNDPVDEIQLEAISTQLSFFLLEDIPARRRIGFVIEVRSDARAAAAFDAGPLAAWPAGSPPELTEALVKAVDDEEERVRIEAIYTLGVVSRPPVTAATAEGLIKALDHYDPAIRVAAARVIGRLRVTRAGEALIKAMNDSQGPVRFAAMRALGAIGEERALQALTEQLAFYRKGEGAWSALDALAQIGHPSSIPLFREHLTSRDETLRRAAAEGIGRAGDSSDITALQLSANTDESPRVRAALGFALQKLGHNYLNRLAEFLGSSGTAQQVQGYLLELGAPVAEGLAARLQDPDEDIRERLAQVMGAVGDATTIGALAPLTEDRSRRVVKAAAHAIERIKMTSVTAAAPGS